MNSLFQYFDGKYPKKMEQAVFYSTFDNWCESHRFVLHEVELKVGMFQENDYCFRYGFRTVGDLL